MHSWIVQLTNKLTLDCCIYRDAFHDTGDGSSVFTGPCDRGNLNMVKLLVKRGADVNIEDTDNQTPLHYGERWSIPLQRVLVC